ncbi:VOC family protein [Cellulomonas alba]|uniref:VOC family protein n=1 Tax=Cellulomonas alba TaxID=3053467 RepID=A0ABT7SFD5_9CELL|nr:VOC family protein [Cellulomonas alba]MDM7854836.1 VOC family protein [Cellulomonas alba]
MGLDTQHGGPRWTTAFLDLPGAAFAASVAFWRGVTATGISAPRGDHGELATLVPADGDAFLRVQRFDGGPRVHLDLHVDDPVAAAAAAVALGAAELFREDHVVLRSPGGFVFCAVPWQGEQRRPGPVGGVVVDQVALDVPDALHAAEVEFWSALTGWAADGTDEPELTLLRRHAGIPLRLLLQRLGSDDPRQSVTAHLDLAAGAARRDVADAHVAAGARILAERADWVVMQDPAGIVYCLTAREPVVGRAD